MRSSKEGSDCFFPPLVIFYLRGSGKLALVSGKMSNVCEFSPFSFFTLGANTFFGSLGLCFRGQVDLFILWFAQVHDLQTSNWVHFHQLLGLPCDVTFSPTLGTYGGHDGPLLSFSVLWEQICSLCPTSDIPLDILQAVTKDDPNPWLWVCGSSSFVADSWFAFQSWPSFYPAVLSFSVSPPLGHELEGSIKTRTELKLVSLTMDQGNSLS